jgi:aminopeptidase-like protein
MTLKPGSRAQAMLSAPSSPSTRLCEDDGGEAMHRLISELYPVCQSMTGDDVRAALDLLRAYVPITVHEVRSGLHQPSHLTWGELLLRGRSVHEVLVFCHICHPSLCNDGLSSIAVTAALAQRLLPTRSRYSYRFLFIPSTIGSITWLALNQFRVSRVEHSLLLDCLGDSGQPSYQRSRRRDAEVDRAVAFVLRKTSETFSIEQFSASGHDERQLCSPVDLPVSRVRLTSWAGARPAGGLTFVEPRYLHDSFLKLLTVIDVLEHNRIYISRCSYGEATLDNSGLTGCEHRRALLCVLNSSDGSKSLLDIASEENLPWDVAKDAAHRLAARELITPIERSRGLPPASERRVNRSYH